MTSADYGFFFVTLMVGFFGGASPRTNRLKKRGNRVVSMGISPSYQIPPILNKGQAQWQEQS